VGYETLTHSITENNYEYVIHVNGSGTILERPLRHDRQFKSIRKISLNKAAQILSKNDIWFRKEDYNIKKIKKKIKKKKLIDADYDGI